MGLLLTTGDAAIIHQMIRDFLATDEALRIIVARMREGLSHVEAAGAAERITHMDSDDSPASLPVIESDWTERVRQIVREEMEARFDPPNQTMQLQVIDGQLVAVFSNGTRQVIADPAEVPPDRTSPRSGTADR
jgi:hypothetical protein